MVRKEYQYKRRYIDPNDEIRQYNQTVIYDNKEDELHSYINSVTKRATLKVVEIKRLEKLLKTVIRYRGYNKKNMMQRFYRLEHADEIKVGEKSLISKIMARQKTIADDLVSILTFILQLYDEHDAELKQISDELKELVTK